jgi:type 1 glutamine amidotransferase/HEAT repeat protein
MLLNFQLPVFHFQLAYGANAMKRVAAIAAALALIGTARAGEPKPAMTPDEAFAQLQTYDYGQDDKALHFLELHIARFASSVNGPQKRAEMADRLGKLLADPKASVATKVWACTQLRTVGTEAQVPILVGLLDDPKLVEMARGTLEAIPGDASLAALREAFGKLKDRALIGAVNSLGIRRDAQSVPGLAKLLASPDAGIAAAAAEALSRIATAEAATVLLKAELPEKALVSLQDAQLRCAALLAAAGDKANAEALYQAIWTSKRPEPWRFSGLAGLAAVAPEKAIPLVLEVLDSENAYLQASAVRLTRQLPGEKVTAALVQRLGKLDAKGQVLLLGILAERADRSAAEAVARLALLVNTKEAGVRVAAVQAMGKLGDVSSVEWLAKLAAAETGAVQAAARSSLAGLLGADLEPKLIAMAGEGGAAIRAEAMRALATRRSKAATAVLLKSAGEADAAIRKGAFDALAATGQPDGYPKLVQLLATLTTPADADAAEKAALAVGGRLEKLPDRVSPLVAALPNAAGPAKASILRVLSGFGGAEALQAVRSFVGNADATLNDAAVRSLGNWPDEAPAGDLLKLAKDSDNVIHKALALRGYLRLAQLPKDEAARLKMLEQVRPIATTADAKKMLLSSLAEVPDPGSLHVALTFLDDREVQAEAAVATLRLGKTLARTEKKAVQAAMKKVMETVKDKAVTDQAEAVSADTLKASPEVASQKALQPDRARSEARKKDLGKSAPKGYRVVCYLDCGPDSSDGAKDGPTLRLVDGASYAWPEAEAVAPTRYGTVFFTPDEVPFEAARLAPKKSYQLGFSWWDFDHDTRIQSVWAATGKGERKTKLVDKTNLPSYVGKKLPEEKTVPIPGELYADGALRISFVNEGAPNVVVSEVWLLESEAEGARGPAGAAAPAREGEAPAEPTTKPEKRVLIVTGQDSAHNWRATAPELAKVLKQDSRLDVKVVEDADFLASDELNQYDVVVIHFQNPKPLPKTQEDRANLQKFVEGGKGLVVVHFGCGAFQEWPEFRKVAGRAWDPKLRAHDPFGKFQVDITDVKHPITEGMKSFETPDELYTCLAGDAPIEVLATSISKVDKKVYPMAFVLNVGKGRVFHSTLGHDVRAITNPPVAELYRRATAWAAGLPAVLK